MTDIHFTIPIAPVSKKNSQRIVRAGAGYKLLPSKAYADYEQQAGRHIPKVNEPIASSVNLRCLFYMPTHRKCDLTNMLEAIDDVLVKYNFLADDNFTVVTSHDGSRVMYDKINPRTEVYITWIKENNND